MKLKLKSNFFEPWHSAFDSEGLEFRLMNNEGPDRVAMFSVFKRIGLKTPIFGKYKVFLQNKFENGRNVVVYDDIKAHFGEGKRVVNFGDLSIYDKTLYMSEFISPVVYPTQGYVSSSTRQLFIGDQGFTYNYYSLNDWRSNNGRVTISEPIRIDLPKWRQEIQYPLVALDYIGEYYDLKAIDLNISPGLSGLRLPLSSTQIVLSIKTWLTNYVQNQND